MRVIPLSKLDPLTYYNFPTRYGVYIVNAEKFYSEEEKCYYGRINVIRGPFKEIREGNWDMYFEYPEEMFRIFCRDIEKRQITLYLCLRKQTLLPKEIIKMIMKPLWIYDGPFYKERRPTPHPNRFKDEMVLVIGFIGFCCILFGWIMLSKNK
jgi:hypothetical protein